MPDLSGAEAVGVDLGGTKMLVGVLRDDGELLHRRIVTVRGLGADEVLAALELELRAAIEARPAVSAIGLGIPCTIDRDLGHCVNAVNLPLRDVPVRDLVAGWFGLPTVIDNDGNTAALAEHRRGAAQGASTVVLLTIGTGIGGGLIIDGEPFRGSSGAGAELGHMVVDLNGPPCQGSCPNHGCIESIASGTAIAARGRAGGRRGAGLGARRAPAARGRRSTPGSSPSSPAPATSARSACWRRSGAASAPRSRASRTSSIPT